MEPGPPAIELLDEPLTIEFRRPGDMPGHHWHRQIEVNIPLGGPVRYLIQDRQLTVPAGHVALFWGLIPHRLVDHDGCERMAILNIPLPLFLSFALGDSLQTHLLQGGVALSAQVGLFGDHEIRRWQQDAASPLPARQWLLQEEIALVCKRVALSGWHNLLQLPLPGQGECRALGPSRIKKLQQMLNFLARHHQHNIRVQDLAREVRLHPNYAMQLFKQVMGATIKQYLLRMKIHHARVLLADSNRSILDIALSTGFSGQSRFYDAFGRITGMTPQQYRRQSRGEE